MSIKNSIYLVKIKNTSMKLRANHQIPYYLYYLICNLDSNSSESLIRSLTRDSEHYLRIKGYYKRYPMIHDETNKILRDKYDGLERK